MHKIGNRDQGTGIRDQGSRLESIAGWQNVLITNNDPSPQSPVPSPFFCSQSPFPKISVPLCLRASVRGLLMVLLAGCTSLVQKGGEVLDGSAFAEKTIAVYRVAGTDEKTAVEVKGIIQKTGEEVLEISSGVWPGFALRGTMPEPDGSLDLREARFLSSHTHGWNEFTMELYGSAVFQNLSQNVGVLHITEEVERVDISSGRIRLKSGYITGTAAITLLRNRRERVTALVEWMNGQMPGGQETHAFADIAEFAGHWKRRLFPELVPPKNRPGEYSVDNAEWRLEDSVRWNVAYTESLFPEWLWEYRNSGSMLRDWEEALPWIFMEYSWNAIIDSFNNAILQKVK